jgi:hypothetical protein
VEQPGQRPAPPSFLLARIAGGRRIPSPLPPSRLGPSPSSSDRGIRGGPRSRRWGWSSQARDLRSGRVKGREVVDDHRQASEQEADGEHVTVGVKGSVDKPPGGESSQFVDGTTTQVSFFLFFFSLSSSSHDGMQCFSSFQGGVLESGLIWYCTWCGVPLPGISDVCHGTSNCRGKDYSLVQRAF